MTEAFDGTWVDGSAYTDVVGLAHRAPSWLDALISAWSTYGLGLFAVLMLAGWWRARRTGSGAAVVALAVPFVVVLAYALNDALKLVVREDRPCQSLRVVTLEACPAPGDWSFPSNHMAIAAAAAVALYFVSRPIGCTALLASGAMGVSRVWVGVHYPHDVIAGFVVGALVASVVMIPLTRHPDALARRLATTRLRPLLSASAAAEDPASDRVATPT
ncbi:MULTISPECIES: phosphatase PAP2 family protein [unclassified Streptomyces]|uniref:phosphatase PAP2 family protein n=1 Tax=unclassified Streptomyces TaxID=2593676 RepID=UPI003D8EF3E8